MTLTVRPLVAGNWKMNGTGQNLAELAAMTAVLDKAAQPFDALICLPATLLSRASEMLKGKSLLLGGEDCHAAESGAHTGDISAPMLKDAGADYVIVGHSERRTDHGETDAMICAKTQSVWKAGLTAIVCVGETLQQRDSGKALDVIGSQFQLSVPDGADAARLVIAYEPVWAIGTGKIPTEGEVAEVHAFLRERLHARFGAGGNKIRLLYGGSVKPDNAATLLRIPHVNGALIGGASLKAKDFLAICHAYHNL